MIIRKAYKFRLKPDHEQVAKLHSFAGHCRFVWNKVLALNLKRLEEKKPLIWYHEADFWAKLWKQSDEYHFLKEAPAHCIQQKLKDLNKAFKEGFDKKQPLKRIPRFKKKGMGDGFRFPEPKHIQVEHRKIKLPKLGWIKFYQSRAIDGKIKNATVTYSAGHWYVSVQVELDIGTPKHTATSAIGIDMGIKKYIALSTGEHEDPINPFKKYQDQLSKAQRRLSKKKKFSENWKKQKKRLQKIHRKIAHVRKDFQHKLSTKLSNSHAMIVVEALKISNMSRSASGTLDNPGKNVKAKSGLNKSILDQAWGEFKRQISYKLAWKGGIYLEVPAPYTSQTCSVCGEKDKASRQGQERYVCTSCGYEANADINAAKNILAAGHAVLACGEDALATSMKQEPLGTSNLVPA